MSFATGSFHRGVKMRPVDALKINIINAGLAGEGEANPANQPQPLFSHELDALINMLAADSVNTPSSNRSRPAPAW
jgi:hypothetical protein